MIKAIILDIDGTLLNSEHQISEKTKNKLINLQKQGIKVMLASGRPTQGLWRFAKQLELDKYEGFLISFNGAVITDCKSKKNIYNKPIDLHLAKEVLNWVEQFNFIVCINKDDYLCVKNVYHCYIDGVKSTPFNVLEHEARGNDLSLMEVTNWNTFLDFNPTKILISGTPQLLAQFAEQIAQPFHDRLNFMFTAAFFFEFTALGVDKASALKTALPKYGINQEHIIAFGDGQNDRSMLEYAGVGVAMGNAIAELKAVADFVTLSNDEDGIVYALDKLLK